jgi:hypothetical protein
MRCIILSIKWSKQSLLSAPTRAGSPRYLSEIDSIVIWRASQIYALVREFVLGKKKMLDFTKLTI